MGRLIDADAFFNDFPELRDYEYASQEYEVDAEPTEEQVKEYCRKRGLVIVDSELFNEMKARWSAEPGRHGHWVLGKELSREYIGDVCVSIHYDKCWCSECDYPVKEYPFWTYCPNCGAKMDEVCDERI